MDNFLLSTLLFISSFLGVAPTPAVNGGWQVVSDWQPIPNGDTFTAKLNSPDSLCKSKDGYIAFPRVINGIHMITVNGHQVEVTGDSSFAKASSFYAAPFLTCAKLDKADVITWQIIAPSKYFSRFHSWPKYVSSVWLRQFLDEGLFLFIAAGIFFLASFSFFVFRGKKLVHGGLQFQIGALIFCIYSVVCINSYIGLPISMLTANKISDFSLIISVCLIFSFFRQAGYLSGRIFNIHLLVSAISATIILFGSNIDTTQFGTSLSFSAALVSVMAIFYGTAIGIFGSRSRKYKSALLAFGALSVGCATINDTASVLGIYDGPMVFSLAVAAMVFLIAMSVNDDINHTFSERDELLRTLESRVEEKTKHLTEALATVQKSQAELVESSRLASLGTLSAGIAHEINNSINFVNGAIVPLERKVAKSLPENEKEGVQKLFKVIKEGTQLTMEIVASLRSYTGLNQAEMRDVNLFEVAKSVGTILKSKIGSREYKIHIDPSLHFYGHHIGINQILMNLISNALDALPPGEGSIQVTAVQNGGATIIEVQDNGCGIPPEIQARIFDPFFTTKEVGKGTGLGLHIVKKEVDRHNGQIELESSPKQGTKFRITLPMQQNNENLKEVA